MPRIKGDKEYYAQRLHAETIAGIKTLAEQRKTNACEVLKDLVAAALSIKAEPVVAGISIRQAVATAEAAQPAPKPEIKCVVSRQLPPRGKENFLRR